MANWIANRWIYPKDVQIASSWHVTIQPYIKSQQILLACPSFDLAKHGRGMDQADCDGDGTPGSASGYLSGATVFSHYGITFAVHGGSCTPDAPYFSFAGSSW